MENLKEGNTASSPPVNVNRRRFLTLATSTAGVVVMGALVVPMIRSLEPTAADAAESIATVDLTPVEPGMQLVVMWQQKPVVIVNRTPEMLKTLAEAEQKGTLKDPQCDVPQQPPYCKNMYRSRVPEWLVMVKICNHLCCIPHYRPKRSSVTASWLGGFYCPCHGSMYDLSGRVINGSPAPHNMAVPEYTIAPDHKSVKITKMFPQAHLC
uniref:Ubiquinol-cytochrome c reductase iron-sulfur subunit n=1 Tax=mine drainage metagenome TaxID=410659 RepID=E6QUE9_9ZZZZ